MITTGKARRWSSRRPIILRAATAAEAVAVTVHIVNRNQSADRTNSMKRANELKAICELMNRRRKTVRAATDYLPLSLRRTRAEELSLAHTIPADVKMYLGCRAIITLVIALSIIAAACNAPQPSHNSSAVSERPARAPERIVSLTPSATEILYGVGAFERVVAVSDYCNYPPEAAQLPRVGGWMNTNIERIAALRPDLVVVMDSQAPFIKDRLDALGLPVLVVGTRTLADVFRAIESIGRATGNERETQRLLTETRAAIEEVRARARDRERTRVLCVVDRVPGTLRDLYAATEESFLAELIEIAGGEVVAPSAASGYGQISKEAVLALDPAVIIDIVQGAEGSLGEDTESVWRELASVRAVRERRVYTVRDTRVVHPSQFVAQTARRFAEIIHPEAFTNNAGER